jgi:hypothetical protein
MHRIEMGEHEDAGPFTTPRARDRQMARPPVAAGNTLDLGAGVSITFGDERHQSIDAFDICRVALNLDPPADAVKNV